MTNKIILCIDIGNSRSKFGLFKEDKIYKLISNDTKDIEEDSIKKNFQQENIEKVIISSVAKSNIKEVIQQTLKTEPYFIGPNDLTININYDGSLGSDRVANIEGALKLFPQKNNILIFDLGTATTACLIDKNQYLGGLIFPGIHTQLSSLISNTMIPLSLIEDENIDISEKQNNLLQKGTKKQISCGIKYMHYQTIKSLREKIKLEFPELIIIGTGGNANRFNALFDIAEPNLGLIGLNCIASKMR